MYLYGFFRKVNENRYLFSKEVIEITAQFVSTSDKEVELKPNTKISDDVIIDSRIFNMDQLKTRGKNYMFFSYNGKFITMADSYIYKYVKSGKKKIKKTVFDGQFISMTFNKPVKSFIYILPNDIKNFRNKLLNYINYEGDRVQLENPLFNNKYKVYSHDEIQARYILSLKIMERMIELDTIFPDKKYIVFRENGKLTLFIENESLEKVRNYKLPIFKSELKEKKYFMKVFEKIKNISLIYEILDLNNKLYQPKEFVKQAIEKSKLENSNKAKSTNVAVTVIPERKILQGELKGTIESKKYGYSYCYKNAINVSNVTQLTLPYGIKVSVTYFERENSYEDILQCKIKTMTEEFGWKVIKEPTGIEAKGNKFTNVVYEGDNGVKMSSYYYCNNSDYAYGVNFRYYENDIVNILEHIEEILATFITKNKFSGRHVSKDNEIEFKYKNAIDNTNEKITFASGFTVNVGTKRKLNDENVEQYIERFRKILINENGWETVEYEGKTQYGTNVYHKVFSKVNSSKMTAYILENDDDGVWCNINFKHNDSITEDDVEYILQSVKKNNEKIDGTKESIAFGYKYDYINAKKIVSETKIILQDKQAVYFEVKDARVYKSENEAIEMMHDYWKKDKWKWIRK